MRSLRAGMPFGRGCISMRSLCAGMTFRVGITVGVSESYANMILFQQRFVEHLHTLGINMILAIIEIRRLCIPLRFLSSGMTFDIPIISPYCLLSSNNFEFSDTHYGITSFFGNIWFVRSTYLSVTTSIRSQSASL